MYPTNDELEKIKKWDFGLFEEEKIREFVEYIQKKAFAEVIIILS